MMTHEDMEEAMKYLGDRFLGLGFVLMIFDYNNPGPLNLITNADPDSLPKVFRQAADGYESSGLRPFEENKLH